MQRAAVQFGTRLTAFLCFGAAGLIILVTGLPSRIVPLGIIQIAQGQNGQGAHQLPIMAAVNAFAPPIQGRTTNDLPLDTRQLAGRPLILNFWASWCIPCITEMPALDSTLSRYEALQLVYIGVGETVGNSRYWATRFGLASEVRAPMLADLDGRIAALYGVRVLPTSVFIRRDGTISAIHLGALDLPQLDSLIEMIG